MTVKVDPQALAASLRRLQERREGALLEQSLRGVVEACTELFQTDGSGLMLADEHNMLRYIVATDAKGQILEEAQIKLGEGPCVDAFVEDVLTDTRDVATDPRWPELGREIRAHQVGAVLGVPVRLSSIPVGSLDVFRTEQRWDDSERAALTKYAEVVSTMLQASLQAERAGELASQLNYALDYRVPIERGVGYLMARDELTSVQAFNRLRAASRNSRRKIGDVATELLSTGQLPHEAEAEKSM